MGISPGQAGTWGKEWRGVLGHCRFAHQRPLAVLASGIRDVVLLQSSLGMCRGRRGAQRRGSEEDGMAVMVTAWKGSRETSL